MMMTNSVRQWTLYQLIFSSVLAFCKLFKMFGRKMACYAVPCYVMQCMHVSSCSSLFVFSSSLIFFVASSLIFFIIEIFSIWLLYQGSLTPVHRWGFSTSAVTGPQQGGRLALPPGVATQKTLKKLLNRVKQRQSFNLRQQVRFCISFGSFDQKSSNSVCPHLLKTNLCHMYREQKPRKSWHSLPSMGWIRNVLR